jgi:hypothetical protein
MPPPSPPRAASKAHDRAGDAARDQLALMSPEMECVGCQLSENARLRRSPDAFATPISCACVGCETGCRFACNTMPLSLFHRLHGTLLLYLSIDTMI